MRQFIEGVKNTLQKEKPQMSGGESPGSPVKKRTLGGPQAPTIWGNHRFNFDLKGAGKSLYQTGVLVAEATKLIGTESIPIPVRCKWMRVCGKNIYAINGITSNTYQLSAEDIGHRIRVQATSLEQEAFPEMANAEFGPVYLDPSARKHLDQLLSIGGSTFPLSQYQEEGNEKKEKEEVLLTVGADKIHLSVKNSMGEEIDKIESKYTIDYPKITLHPLDTNRLHIAFVGLAGDPTNMDGNINLDRSLELVALSKQSRDLIALIIRCFSAHQHHLNSKLIAELNNPQIQPSSGIPEVKMGDGEGEGEQYLSEILLNLDSVKRELYNTLQLYEDSEGEKHKLVKSMSQMEEEMEFTIGSYQMLIGQGDDQENSTANPTTRYDERDQEINTLKQKVTKLENNLVKFDSIHEEKEQYIVNSKAEKRDLEDKLRESIETEKRTREALKKFQGEQGIPQPTNPQQNEDYQKLQKICSKMKHQLKALDNKNSELQSEINNKILEGKGMESQLEGVKIENEDLRSKNNRLEEENKVHVEMLQNKEKLAEEENFVGEVKKEIAELKVEMKKVEGENESLLVQRSALTKQKDSLRKEFEKLDKEHLANNGRMSEEVDRLRNSNERFILENLSLGERINNLEKELKHKTEELNTRIIVEPPILPTKIDIGINVKVAVTDATINVKFDENEEMRNEINELRIENEKLVNEREELMEEMEEIRGQLDEKDEQIMRVKNEYQVILMKNKQ